MRPKLPPRSRARGQFHRIGPDDGREAQAQFAKASRRSNAQHQWYPAVPPGIEDIEGKVLDRVKAAN
jgi:spermidine/putrescine transport system substrate-binding protein